MKTRPRCTVALRASVKIWKTRHKFFYSVATVRLTVGSLHCRTYVARSGHAQQQLESICNWSVCRYASGLLIMPRPTIAAALSNATIRLRNNN